MRNKSTPLLHSPHRYIVVKNNGETFVAYSETLLDLLTNPPRNFPRECEIMAIVTDRFCMSRKGDWQKRAAKTRFGKLI